MNDPGWLAAAHARASNAMVEAERAGLEPGEALDHGLRAALLFGDYAEDYHGMRASLSGLAGQLARVVEALDQLREQAAEQRIDVEYLDEWLYEHQPASALFMAQELIKHVGNLHMDWTQVGRLMQLWVDPIDPDEAGR